MFSRGLGDKPLKFQPLEHEVLRQLRLCLKDDTCLAVACSGGRDSVALLHVLSRLRPVLPNQVFVFHIHHGPTCDPQQLEYRQRALAFVRKISQGLDIPFLTNSEFPERELSSEGELRDFRHAQLNGLAKKCAYQVGSQVVLATAHHWQDQVETRLMRLIRGTSPTGFRGMTLLRGGLVKPLLETPSEELENYVGDLGIEFVEDPSNSQVSSFRNWIRKEWLPALEQRQEGGVRRLALSLESLALDPPKNEAAPPAKLARIDYGNLNYRGKLDTLANYVRSRGVYKMSESQLKELVKRLDSPRREHKFHLLKLDWSVNAQHIWARPH